MLRKISVNALIVELLEEHYDSAGFPSGNQIVGRNGRRMTVRVREDHNHAPGLPHCLFYIDDASTEKELACYTIGCSQQLLDRFAVNRDDQYKLTCELGIALLQYCNKVGMDITKLLWDQFPKDEYKRILNTKDLRTTTGFYMLSADDFIRALRDGLWQDMHIEYKTYRTVYTVSGKSQGYFADLEVFDHAGKHVGHIFFDTDGLRVLHDHDGRYVCHIWYDRLLRHADAEQVEQQIPVLRQVPGVSMQPELAPPLVEVPAGFLNDEVIL